VKHCLILPAPDESETALFFNKVILNCLTVFSLLWALDTDLVAGAEWRTLPGYVPAVIAGLAPQGRLPATNQLSLAIGLPLRNEAALDELIGQLYDPGSTNFHKFLAAPEFAARFGPTEADYQSVRRFTESYGLTVTGTFSNRVVLDVSGRVADVERAFQIQLHTYRHPTEPRVFFAPDTEPSVPTNLPIADLLGLSDYARPTPMAHRIDRSRITPLNYNGTGSGGAYQGADFRHAYVPGSSLNGAGQVVALFELDGYFAPDITNYEAICGYANVPLQTVWVNIASNTPPGFSGVSGAVDEVSLDIEMAVAMAPGLSAVMIYEGTDPYDVFNQIASDNAAKQISSSWFFGAGPNHHWHGSGTTLDSIFKIFNAQGQAMFQASGDADAYTGSQAVSSSAGPIPVDSPYLTSVGGTSLTMNGANASWAAETVWNWNNSGEPDVGSGGGVTPNYSIPAWQTNVSMAANNGSTVNRNFPDVALTADAIFVVYSNGLSGYFGGTSCAAPLWAGFCALANQQSLAGGGSNLGFLNPAFYAIANASCFTNCFNDITNGNNIGSQTAGLYNAVPGYDLATGLGTPNGTNLINALIAPPPVFNSQPIGENTTSGAIVTLTATTSSTTPVGYFWLFNGTNLPAGGNVSGVTTNTLVITAATTNNSGSYQLVASNLTGMVVSRVAVLNVGFVPTVSVSPASLTLLAGSNAVFTATSAGSTPFSYKWKKNGTNFAGAGISGTNTSALTLAGITTGSAANYTVVVTNLYGMVTSSIVPLTVVLPPTITGTLANRTLQCGMNTNTFTIAAAGTAPLFFQWSLDGSPVAGATNASFSLTNLFQPNHAVAVAVTNYYAGLTSNAVLTIIDTLAPVITLNGASVLTNELGSAFTDPGATAMDLCEGSVSVAASGVVNPAVVGTNLLTYTATDGNGNTNTTTRTVIVRDTTLPVVLWSFTNLIFAADSNCVAAMPNVTGTNFILATDLSGALTISQSPTNGFELPVGTNVIVTSVADASGNTAFSTNQIVVTDQTPPVILIPPQSQTNDFGTTASFAFSAAACTPQTSQWFFNNSILPAQTNRTLTLSNVNFAAVGNYSVVVTADGGSTTSTVAALTVNPNSAAVTLAASENPSGFKDNLNFTAVVTPASATGTVQFYTNSTAFDLEPLVAGQATSLDISSLPRGTNLITAVYSGDASDLPATNGLAQIVTNHLPQVASAFYTLVAGLDLNIAVADLATNWSDADGDTPFIADISISTNGVVVTNATPFLFYVNTNYVGDQFVCAISDGFGGTNFQTVNITVVPQTNTTPSIAALVSQPGGVSLKLNGGYGSTYILQSTTDFIFGNWVPVATNTLDVTGVWQFTDTQATNLPQRFYRLQLLQ
jgi:hypothetical protein